MESRAIGQWPKKLATGNGRVATWAAYFAYYNRNFREFSTFDRIIVYVVRPDAPAARLAPSGGILGRVLPRAMACFARVL